MACLDPHQYIKPPTSRKCFSQIDRNRQFWTPNCLRTTKWPCGSSPTSVSTYTQSLLRARTSTMTLFLHPVSDFLYSSTYVLPPNTHGLFVYWNLTVSSLSYCCLLVCPVSGCFDLLSTRRWADDLCPPPSCSFRVMDVRLFSSNMDISTATLRPSGPQQPGW